MRRVNCNSVQLTIVAMKTHSNHINNPESINSLSILKQLPGYIVCTDTTHRVNYYCNERYSHIAGFPNTDEILGSRMDEMQCKAAECADTFVEQNTQVIDNRTSLKIIDIHPYRDDEVKILLTHKSPILDNHNNAHGVLCQATEITENYLLKMASILVKSDQKYHSKKNMRQRSYQFSNQLISQKLTEREMECLFYYVRGKSAKDIAAIFSISKRTVETHIDNIKFKLHCDNKTDLIHKSIENKYINYLPERILSDININVSNIIEIIPNINPSCQS